MKKTIFLVLIILMTNLVHAQQEQNLGSWTIIDYGLATFFVVGGFIDYSMSVHALKSSSELYELNPLFGKKPNYMNVATIKSFATAAVIYIIATAPTHRSTDRTYRRIILYTINAITWGVVVSNIVTMKKAGVKFGLSFSIR